MAEAAEAPSDLKAFKRNAAMIAIGRGRYTAQFELHALAQLGYGLDPRGVPVEALRLMGATCPAVYPAEQTLVGIIRRSDLFSIRHADPRIVAEHEAWLWQPDVLPKLLAGAGRGVSYGNVACVLDWERKTLRVVAPTKNESGATRTKTLVQHTHFRKAFEVHPDATTYNVDDQGEVVSVNVLGATYDASRVAVWSWDPEFGEIFGQGARQRAWLPYCTYLIVRLLRDKYLERSVDSPRIVFAPDGKVVIDSTEYQIPDYAVRLLMDLSGSGAIGFPSATDAQGKEKYRVQTLDLPDRRQIWSEALDRCAAEVYQAYLVPPTMAGGLEGAGGGAARALDGMLREFVENLALFCATGLTKLVQAVHRANYDPEKVEPPEVVATDVGKAAARKLYMDVLRLANSASRGEIAMRSDLPKLLDLVGIPLREAPVDPFAEDEPEDEPETAPPGQPGEEPGRPRDPFGEREERRADAREESGEEDTGGKDVEREERE